MKKLPIGIQNIREIIEEGYVYIDKTGFAQQLIQTGKHYFLSRPRRFGKSLFLSTLEEILKGNKELFQDCSIYHGDYSWEEHPVLAFSFADLDSSTPDELKLSLEALVNKLAAAQGIKVEGPSARFRFQVLVEALAQKNRVVVLIDEYDHPIINNLHQPEVAKRNRYLLKDFFTTLKGLDKHLKLTFITGISKFSQVSLFSGANNLQDITMDPRYATMMGYTEEELKNSFAEHITAVAQERSQQDAAVKEVDILDEVKYWYNGYRFTKAPNYVYNPFSTLRFMNAKEAMGYWYSTGTPSLLINQLKKHPENTLPLAGITAKASELMDISSIDQIDLKALMFQSGYLTIQDYTNERYHLGFPNHEVSTAFVDSLVKHFAKVNTQLSLNSQEALREHQLNEFFEQIITLFAQFPYQLFIEAKERTYHAMLLGLLNGMGLEVVAERPTHVGRIDLVVVMAQYYYIFELKLDSSAQAALDQIHDKEYCKPYLRRGKEVVLVGLNFSAKERNISDWVGELRDETGQLLRHLAPAAAQP